MTEQKHWTVTMFGSKSITYTVGGLLHDSDFVCLLNVIENLLKPKISHSRMQRTEFLNWIHADMKETTVDRL